MRTLKEIAIQLGRIADALETLCVPTAKPVTTDNEPAKEEPVRNETPSAAPQKFRTWTEEEDAKLAELYKLRRKDEEISKYLNRTEAAIQSRRSQLGLVMYTRKK